MDIKYTNIESELPDLQDILKNSLQKEVLDIKSVDESSDKYHFECENCPLMADAQYVVYSPHVQKKFQKYEHYVFLDNSGKTLCHRSGKDFNLFGMLKPCINLRSVDKNDFYK